MLFRCYDNSFALKVKSIQLQNYSLWYLLPTKIKTEDILSQHCPTADCYFQVYVSQVIATFGARDSHSTVKGTKIHTPYSTV